MPKVFTSQSQKTGELGETIACMFLMKHGYEIVERNYTKKWGEIDIIAKKGDMTHLIEVKSKSVLDVSYETKGDYRPEDNMHPWKVKRLIRTIETYLLERHVSSSWQFDLAVVLLDNKNKKARVELIKDIILS